ncbi:MAG: multiheme c-type cytochrome [Syntrophobacteraceae bacterium]
MSSNPWPKYLPVLFILLALAACSSERAVNIEAVKSQPKTYVGSETCKTCHLEHYDSWKMTLHSRMLQDAQKNRDAIVADWDEKKIRADLATLADKLKAPPDQVYIPKVEDIKYTIGSQWKQRYVVEKEGTLYIAPVQYNVDTHRWVNYHEADWDKRSWLLKCGGCHATGADLEKNTFAEPAVACEACHGSGSWHTALPKTAVFEKRQTILNPSKLTMGVSVQICGSCHNRGKATKHEGADWAVGYQPGKALEAYFQSISYAGGNVTDMYANEFSKGHHQQYIDWVQSKHFAEGVVCTSCHFVHQIGIPPTRSQTKLAGSKECLSCHEALNNNKAHSIHAFGNCVGCHMPRIAKSAETGDLHSHVFMALLPRDTLANPVIPNSCQTCHKHKDADLKSLQDAYDALTVLPKPVGPAIQPVEVRSKPKK